MISILFASQVPKYGTLSYTFLRLKNIYISRKQEHAKKCKML